MSIGEQQSGLRIPRRYTIEGHDPYESIEWQRRDSRITNPDGSVVFEVKDAEVPATWSQVATDIIVSKYFRKAGVPLFDADGRALVDEKGAPVLGGETSARQVFDRLASTWRWWGETHGYFASTADAQAFEDEMKFMLANQIASPNSPQWFNTGLAHAYGITGTAQGFWFVDPKTGEMTESPDAYSHPAPHACFINSVKDDLVNPGGIMDLWVREARLFKMGSGTGTNFSQIRAENEKLSGGGKSSGVMGFLRIGDRAAGAIKSGGTTRRAAKMVILDIDHPDIEEFIDWKKHEEEKARVLIQHGGYPADFNGEAYSTVSGQNSNNSVRVPNEFIKAVMADGDWELRERTTGTVRKTIKARALWRKIAEAAWACADPGVQFDTIINEWHTSPAGGKIRATNPCFPGDTRVATDKGLIQFRDLVSRVADGESFQVYTHDATNQAPTETISLTTPYQVMITGKNQILRLEFSDGRVLRLTPNHRLWTANRGWVQADELDTSDEVRLLDQDIEFGMASWSIPVSSEPRTYQARFSRKNTVVLPEKWTEEFAHYLGWLVGDGSLTTDTAVTVYGTEAEQKSVMIAHQRLLTEINGGVPPKPTKMGNGTYQLRLGRHAFMNFLEALGVSRKRAAGKKIPWSVFEAPKPIVAAFMRGLYDADGCVRIGDDTRYVGLASSSQALARDTQLLLNTFGIKGTIYVIRRTKPESFKYVTKAGQRRTYQTQPLFDLRISGLTLERFHKSIGFGLERKARALQTMLSTSTRYRTKSTVRLRSRTEDGWETTFNLSEPKNHSYLAEAVVVANCSEYVFIDDTACNLASINLVKFYDDATATFDTEGYEHAIRLWTMALEISVTMAHFPSREIAQGSYDYRTLGLGYANLGTLLMRMGLPYDSDAGRAVAGAVTAILTGYAYATSAELAASIGPFPKYAENREAMLRVVRNHRRAAYNAAQSEYDGLSHYVMGIESALTPVNLLTAARQSWDLALDMGERHGYRNAQVTVIAPTGCLVGDSLVPTQFGLVRLASLGNPQGEKWQELGIEVGTDEGEKRATQFYINGVEPIVTINTTRGYRIQGTPTHRIKVVGREGMFVWKRFAEIQKEDLVPLQLGQLIGSPRAVRLADIGEITRDVAELMGLVVGFGHSSGDMLHIGGGKPSEAALLLKRIFNEETPHTEEGGLAVSLTGKPRLRAMAAFAGASRIPDAVLATNDPEIYRAFSSQLLGLLLVESLARDVQNLELAIGQPAELIAAEGGYRVIAAADFTAAEFLLDGVASVELGPEQMTYDLSVPDNVTYVANGFVSHNTIGLQMDCDTTGVEPDFALVKFKKLAGGGYFKIVNQSVAPALGNLGYAEAQIDDIIRYIVGTSSLEGAPHINKPALIEKGFDEADLARLEKALPAVFELRHAFNPFVLGEDTMQRLGFTADEYATFDFDLLRSLGYTSRQIREATEWICGRQMIEGAPHLAAEHLAVFDTANRNGRDGQRLIHHKGHIKMLAATQPFLSGAASKTINMPNEATVEDIEESYMLSYELGVKCMALYRDGSKASQPLSAGSDDAQSEEEPEAVTAAHERDKQILWGRIPAGMSPTQAYSQGMHPPRFVLPSRRSGYTQEARIGGHKVYLRTGEYDDGTLGEVFIDLAKEGATLRGILSCFAIAVSKGLQFGVPLDEFVDTFTFQTFEPRGMVEGHPNIKMANSIVDYVFRALAVEYLERDELAQVPPNREGELPEPKKGLAAEAGVQLDLTDAVAEEAVTAMVSAVRLLEGKPSAAPRSSAAPTPLPKRDAGTAAMQSALSDMMGDAPLCDTCGHITIRNGSCYKCLNCGNSLGCS